jgi:cobalamin-dependent methionine synthase I
MANSNNHCAWRDAMHDISEHIYESKAVRKQHDRYFVCVKDIFNPKQRELNRLMGIHAVNKGND